MCKSGIVDTKPSISLKRSCQESQSYYSRECL